MEFAIILLVLLLSAFFSGSEMAYVAANRLRVEVLARRDGVVGPIVRDFLQNPSNVLTTTLVGNTITLVVYSTFVAIRFNPTLQQTFDGVFGFRTGGIDVAVLAGQTIIAGFILLILGELLPKTVLRETANKAVFGLAVPLRVSYYLLLPIAKLAAFSAPLVVRLFRVEGDPFSDVIRRDVEATVQENEIEGNGELEGYESELLANVLAMAGIRVRESMIPRTDVVAVDENTPLEDLLARFIDTGLSKLPVYRENIDSIVGVVFAYDLFAQPGSLADILRPAKFVPESKRSKDLLREFLSTNTSIAVVIDEYGGTAGLVTREDLLEELFGDIQDEFDRETEVLRQSGDGSLIASGRVHIDEIAERFGIDLPAGDYDTVAGYLLERIGAIPSPQAHFRFDGFRFDILKATASRIDLVRLTREREQQTAA